MQTVLDTMLPLLPEALLPLLTRLAAGVESVSTAAAFLPAAIGIVLTPLVLLTPATMPTQAGASH